MAPRTATVAAAAAAFALGLGAWLFLATPPAPPEIGGYVLATPRELPPVELVDEHGSPFRPQDFVGHWSFLYFGYTYCPDVCPLTLVELNKVKLELAADGFAEPSAYYFVSVDPKRDTPARLAEYVAYFDPELRGLTGPPAALEALAQAADTVFDISDDSGGDDSEGDNYLVSHSSSVVLLDPNGRVHAVFAAPHDPPTLAEDFTQVVASYNRRR
ncbi:MAG TPA: SCO family protein [Gammaproteobacteria bacterium]